MQHTYVYEFFKDFTAPVVALIGITVTGAMAGFGLRSFAKFKREKLEERRIEVALDALAIAYESKFVFQMVRVRAARQDEYSDYVDDSSGAPLTLRKDQRGAYAVLKRLQSHNELFVSVYKIEPRFMAVFGADTEAIFSSLHSARNQLEAAAQTLFEIGRIEDDPGDRSTGEDKRQLKAFIFRGPTEEKENDKIGDLVDGFQAKIEAICRPIVDQQYAKQKSA
ncbi:hypothetical protein [Bradyrhizobium sp. LTSP857]|uniref:hypothetical protein n=1 Tax=Bradyrhizobium sp. LTSP857 TaxID=1619231 RepID=UPI000AF20AC0|nr:hypothetical protein [Bradyrhizobium sp. LTSP857]